MSVSIYSLNSLQVYIGLGRHNSTDTTWSSVPHTSDTTWSSVPHTSDYTWRSSGVFITLHLRKTPHSIVYSVCIL